MKQDTPSGQALRITCPDVPEPPGATWTNAWCIGQEVLVSGMTAHPAGQLAALQDKPLSVAEQSLLIWRKLEALIKAAGGHKYNIVKTVVYLTQMEHKQDINQARAAFFEGGPYPCSTLVGVNALAFPDLKVEIDAWVRLDVDLREAAPFAPPPT